MRLLLILLTLFISWSNTTLAQTPPPSNGLIAHYPFNGNAADVTGNGNNGIVNGATLTTDRFGNPNSAYYFDGINDNIACGNDPSIQIEKGTIQAWVKQENPLGSGFEAIFNKRGNYSIYSNDKEFSIVQYDGASGVLLGSGKFLNDTSWHHLLITFDSYVIGGTKFYFDGVFVGSTTWNTRDHLYNLTIGDHPPYNQNFKGIIDDCAIWNRILTQCEISELYNADLNTGLTAHYPFNGNANDVTGNGNNGIVNGATLTTDRFGNANSAYEFDGINDYIEISDDFDTPEKSIVLWFNAPTINDFGTIFNSDHPFQSYGLTAIWVILNSSNEKNVFMNQGGTSSNIEIQENTWYMATISKSLTSMKFYLNGQLIQSLPTSAGSSSNGFSGTRIGTSRLLDRFFQGKIDDVRIYNRKLSDCDIAKLYDPNSLLPKDTTVNTCTNEPILLSSNLSNTIWFLDGSQIDTGASYLASNLTSSVIVAEGLNACGCVQSDTYRIISNTTITDTSINKCFNELIELNTNLTSPTWFSNGVQIASGSSLITNINANTTFIANGVNALGCNQVDTFQILFNTLPEYSLPDFTILCKNVQEAIPFELKSPAQVEWSENNLFLDPLSVNPIIQPIPNSTNSLIRIKAFVEITSSLNGCKTLDSIELVVLPEGCNKEELLIKIPNVITANGDGFNDKFHIENLDLYPENELVIYNRSGRQVLKQIKYNNDWPQDDMPSGVYFFQIIIGNEFNRKLKGFVHLMK